MPLAYDSAKSFALKEYTRLMRRRCEPYKVTDVQSQAVLFNEERTLSIVVMKRWLRFEWPGKTQDQPPIQTRGCLYRQHPHRARNKRPNKDDNAKEIHEYMGARIFCNVQRPEVNHYRVRGYRYCLQRDTVGPATHISQHLIHWYWRDSPKRRRRPPRRLAPKKLEDRITKGPGLTELPLVNSQLLRS